MNPPATGSAGRWPLPLTEIALVLAIAVVYVGTALLDPNHTYFHDFRGSAIIVLRNAALLGIVALGAAVVIIAGGIDLSAGSMLAFSSMVCALVMVFFAEPDDHRLVTVPPIGIACAIGASLLAALMVGTLHAWLVTSVRLPPFITTLATLVGLRSLARAICEFGTTLRWGDPSQQINVNTQFFQWVKVHNVPITSATFLVLAVLTWIILSRTVLGRHIYALGGNEQAARLSGIRTDNIKWFAYCFGAVTAAIAGIFAMVDGSVAQPVNIGRNFELNAIAAAVVGGCSLQGGIGTVTGTMLGALFLRLVIDAVAKLIKSNADVYEGMIVGIIVALAVTLAQFRQLLQSGREFFPGVRGIVTIPTLALIAALLAIIGSTNVDALRESSDQRRGAIQMLSIVGPAVAVCMLALLGGIKYYESQRHKAP
jgi:ribose/xylose/arabinose/galactoside ABC-type transport system permease subunit